MKTNGSIPALDSYFSDFTARDWESAPADETVRLALVGLSLWTRERAIPAIEESTFCETTAVVSSSREKADDAVEEHDTVEYGLTYDEFKEGVHAEGYDAVYVCTPNATHLEYVEAAAALGKDVLCEKPMEVSSDRAEQMVKTCDERDVTLMIAYRMHTEPAVRRARELIDAGFIGDPVHVHGRMTQPLLERHPDPDQWRLDPELSGGCSLIDIGLYPLNTTRFLLDHEPESVWGRTWSDHEAFADVDERVEFQVTFESGCAAVCSASHNAYQSSSLTVTGTRGEIELQPAFFPWTERTLTVHQGDTAATLTFEQVDQMREEFDYFADCLVTGTEPEPNGEHGLVDIEIIEYIYESAETGKCLRL